MTQTLGASTCYFKPSLDSLDHELNLPMILLCEIIAKIRSVAPPWRVPIHSLKGKRSGDADAPAGL